MVQLSLSLSGGCAISLDGAPVTTFDSNKVRALLAYLAVQSERAHRRESLATLLWPGYPDRSARTNLRNALANLRTAIGDREAEPPFLLITRETLQFNQESDYWLDVAVLSQTRSRVDQVPIERLAEVADLYMGDFLAGFTLEDAVGFDDWTSVTGVRLRRQAWDLLGELADRLEAAGYLGRALTYAWKQLEMDRRREDVHRRVMALLAMTGQRSAALAQYGACRRMLADEIGVEPEPATVALVEKIKLGALTDDSQQLRQRRLGHRVNVGPRLRDHPAEVSSPTFAHNLPAQLTPCIGREREVAEILQIMMAGSCRLITLVGPGGIGKTRLALEVADHLIDGKLGPALFPDGVFYVPLAGEALADAIVPMIARELGVAASVLGVDLSRGGSGAGEPLNARLLEYMRGKRMLLVLDNFEHLMAGAALTVELLRAARGLTLLVTSRARLNVLSESLYPVTALDVPDHHAVCAAEGELSGAVALFAWSAHRLDPALCLEGDALHDAVSICREVGGIPLGVLLAAAWLTVLSPAEIHQRMTNAVEVARDSEVPSPSLDFLRSEWSDIPERQRSMRRVFERSWRLLTPGEQTVFRALSVFRGGFTAAAAYHVGGAVLHDLRSLVGKSLLVSSPDGRFQLHELLRQFAAEKLALDSVGRVVTQAAHADFYAGALDAWHKWMAGPRHHDVIHEMDREIGNARAAWDWIVASGDVLGLSRAVDGLCTYYDWRVRWEEGLVACEAAWERLEGRRTDLEPPSTGGLKRATARVAYRLCWFGRRGRSAGAVGASGVAETVASAAKSALKMIEVHRGGHGATPVCDLAAEEAALWGEMADFMGGRDRPEARRLYQRALALARKAGNRPLESRLLQEAGGLAWQLGELAAAQAADVASLEISRELGDLRGIVDSLQALSSVAMMLGRYDESARLAEQCLEISEGMGDLLYVAGSCHYLALMYIMLGRHEEAIVLLQRCQRTWRDLGRSYPIPYEGEGWAHTLLGDYVRGRALQEKALKMCSRGGGDRARAHTLMTLGYSLMAEGRLTDAASAIRESVETYRPIGQMLEVGLALISLGHVRTLLGQAAVAQELLVEALSIGVDHGSPSVVAYALVVVALLSAGEGCCSQAAEIYRTGSRSGGARARVSPWHDRVIREPLAALCPDEDLLALETGDSLEDTLSALMRAGREVLAELQGGGGDEEWGSGGAGGERLGCGLHKQLRGEMRRRGHGPVAGHRSFGRAIGGPVFLACEVELPTGGGLKYVATLSAAHGGRHALADLRRGLDRTHHRREILEVVGPVDEAQRHQRARHSAAGLAPEAQPREAREGPGDPAVGQVEDIAECQEAALRAVVGESHIVGHLFVKLSQELFLCPAGDSGSDGVQDGLLVRADSALRAPDRAPADYRDHCCRQQRRQKPTPIRFVH